LEDHHEPPHAIAENFAARLALSRQAQKRLSRKVITTAFVGPADRYRLRAMMRRYLPRVPLGGPLKSTVPEDVLHMIVARQ